MIDSSVTPLDETGSEIQDEDVTSFQNETKQEAQDYLQDLEQDSDEVENLSEALEIVSAAVESMRLSGLVTLEEVASFESLKTGVMLSDYDIAEHGGPLNPSAYTVTLEQGINTEFDLAMVLMGKFFKLTFKATERLTGIVSTFLANKSVNSMKVILSRSISDSNKLPSLKWSNLTSDQQRKLIALTQSYTGISGVGEKEVLSTIAAVKNASTGLEVMSKIYMPKHSNIILPLFYIPTSDYQGVVNFFHKHAQTIVPKIETQLNVTIAEIGQIMDKRDWVALSRFDVSMYNQKDKEEIYKLASHVKVDVDRNKKFKKQLSRVYAGTSLLFEFEKKKLANSPKFHQSLPASVEALDKIKDDVISISDTLHGMSKKSESKAQMFAKDFRKFRASKTFKESLGQGHGVNKYSNAAYARIMNEIRDVAHLTSFMSSLGIDVLKAYTGVYTRVNKLNAETTKYIEQVIKITGAK